MKTHKLFLLAVACTWCLGAAAQWQWVDKDGRKVFSDRPPPMEIPDKSILKQPNGSQRSATRAAAPTAAAAAPAATTAPALAPRASAPVASGKDPELERRKAEAEAQEAAKKKAEDEKQDKARAENCKRAQQAKSTYASGQLLSQTNAQGERVFVDDATRTAELKRLDAVIASDCKR